jgi:predicted MFS family arabinose efflux permease
MVICDEPVRIGRAPAHLAAMGMVLIAVCYGLARFAYGLFVPALRAEFGMDAASAGALASAGYGGYCVAIVLATVATARLGARWVAVAAGASATAGTALIAAAPGTAVLAVGVVVAGSSTGLASPPLADAVARWVTGPRASRAQAVVNAGTGLGVLISGPVALLAGSAWRLAWLAFAVIAAAATVWAAVTIPGRTRGDTGRLPSPLLPAGALRLLAAAAVLGAASAAVWTFGRDVVIAGGVGERASTMMWIGLGAAGLAGALTGDLVCRVGLRRAWPVAMLALAAATAMLLTGAPLVFAAAAVFGASYIVLTALLLLWGTSVYPESPAFGVGAAFLMIAVGQALGAPVIGLLRDHAGSPAAFYAAATAAVAGTALRPVTALFSKNAVPVDNAQRQTARPTRWNSFSSE